jgi:3,4-dihydroxy 2-butanone 4-phosphate synthase/GTP cyclohydrolase II
MAIPVKIDGAAGKGLDAIEDIIKDVKAGKMVIMMDDENRENEGDLIMAAKRVRPEDVNFMARFGRGLICLTLGRERCKQLRLPLMVSDTDRNRQTNFTISIEAAEGITTGISAHDRAQTIQTAVAKHAVPEDLCQPGHIFPLMAQPGGVLNRAGHTEAGCDLARLAGFEPAATIVEILNEDGSMARRTDLEIFARTHGLKIGTIADLIRYRLQTEESVERISETPVTTEFGDFRMMCFEDHANRNVHLALVRGDITGDDPVLIRVHVQDTLGDIVGIQGVEMGLPLRNAMRRIADEDRGVLVILRGHEEPGELMDAVQALGQKKAEPDISEKALTATPLKTYGTGAQILRDLGITRMRVLSAPKQMLGISGFGLEVVGYEYDDNI